MFIIWIYVLQEREEKNPEMPLNQTLLLCDSSQEGNTFNKPSMSKYVTKELTACHPASPSSEAADAPHS
jgi:hypothetical protein